MRNLMINKILRAAQHYIENQKTWPAEIAKWQLVNVHHHELTTSVTVTSRGEAFEVWVVIDLGTEETRCL